jgi:Carboxypeptidase regulatory-like domain/TonB dependent receptor
MTDRLDAQHWTEWRVLRSWLLATALILTLLGAVTTKAQVLYGTLTGRITDQTGAVVPNVTVTITSQDTGAVRTATSSEQGDYRVTNLLPGSYTLSLAQSGFADFTQKNIVLEINREVRVDAILQPAGTTQVVTVTGAAQTLQTETAEVNHEISEQQISALPVTSSQGRNYQSLYTLIPGAAAVQEQNSTASNPSRAMSLNVNGVEDMSNTTRIDGAVNTYGWLPYLVAYVPPADAIQTVNIVTNSFNAEQGVAGGASINVITKSGTRDLHGSLWEYYQDAAISARPYTATQLVQPTVPKNIFNEFGFSVGGPVYIPKLITGRDKLFFFQDFERVTRRQLITGTQTVPTTAMLGGDFSAVTSGVGSGSTILYDPQPGGTGPYLPFGSRPTFLSEYGCNCIPAARQSQAAATMLGLLAPISSTITNPNYSSQLANDYLGSGTLGYNRNSADTRIDYLPNDRTTLFGKYSIEPFSITDPQALGAAGGGTFDGGQPGAASGRIQNVGFGTSHAFSSNVVIDADFGYTRQVTGAQSTIDLAAGNFGLDVLHIPGTNGTGTNYAGQPTFAFGNVTSQGASSAFSSLGNSSGASPFLFRDNQFTGDVNLSWTKSKHAMKYGFTYYHFDLNHFQPSSGGGVSSPRGGFQFQGGMTTNSAAGITIYNTLADFILGLPNNGTGIAVAKETQLTDPNSLRWSEFAGYAQDQWKVTPSLTITYGLRYEYYPAPYRDHTGVYRLDPNLPQSGNVIVGGVNGQPQNAGYDMGWGTIFPRLGIAYRVNDRWVVRTGGGITSDPDSLRFLRDAYPEDLSPTYGGTATGTVAIDPTTGTPLTLTNGIPAPVFPDFSSGFASLPVSGSTNTAPADYRRGYIESWNLFVQGDIGWKMVANIGYVGTRVVRQLSGYTLNAAPLPSGNTVCMANGQYNPSSPYFTNALGSNPCNFAANEIINIQHCSGGSAVCYNTGGITMNAPIFSANYNGMQAQLTRNAGRSSQWGLVYTWSKAMDDEDNGAGSGSAGTAFSYPAYFGLNRGVAGYDRKNNLQFWGIYTLPFGNGQKWVNQGIPAAIVGGFQLNGQLSHISGQPFSVSPSASSINSPGNTQYAQLVAPYHQLGGHNRSPGNGAVSGGKAWFDPTSFANPTEPVYTPTQTPSEIASPTFSNTGRDSFRGPGQTYINASIFRDFHVWRESAFQIRFEAFNVLNHPILTNPNTTVGGGTFGYITTFGTTSPAAPRVLQFSGRFNF